MASTVFRGRRFITYIDCPTCGDPFAVDGGGASEALAGEGPGGVSCVEPGSDEGSSRKVPLTRAEIQHRYRERQKAKGPEFQARERARMKARRKP